MSINLLNQHLFYSSMEQEWMPMNEWFNSSWGIEWWWWMDQSIKSYTMPSTRLSVVSPNTISKTSTTITFAIIFLLQYSLPFHPPVFLSHEVNFFLNLKWGRVLNLFLYYIVVKFYYNNLPAYLLHCTNKIIIFLSYPLSVTRKATLVNDLRDCQWDQWLIADHVNFLDMHVWISSEAHCRLYVILWLYVMLYVWACISLGRHLGSPATAKLVWYWGVLVNTLPTCGTKQTFELLCCCSTIAFCAGVLSACVTTTHVLQDC